MINKSRIRELPSTSRNVIEENPLIEPMTIKCDLDYNVNDWSGFGVEVDDFSPSSMGKFYYYGNCICIWLKSIHFSIFSRMRR